MAPASATATHRPATGRAKRVLGRFHVTGVFWYRFHLFGVRILAPTWGVPLVILAFTTFFFLCLRRIRSAIASNLEAVLGPCSWLERERRIYRTMLQFAWCLTERYEQFVPGRAFEVEVENEPFWREATVPARGLILLTAHIGNWEMGSTLPVKRENCVVHVVREEEMDPRAQELVAHLLDEHAEPGYRTHFARHDEPALGIELLGALRRGEIVALQGDRPRAGGQRVAAEIFGRSFELPIGPAALARGAEVSILPVFVFRTGRRRYRIAARPPIVVRRTGDRRADLDEAIRAIARDVEWAIRRAPHQWFCFAPLWPERTRSIRGR